jgi:hypothetical protein
VETDTHVHMLCVMQMVGLSVLTWLWENKFHNVILLVFLRYRILFVNEAYTRVYIYIYIYIYVFHWLKFRQSIKRETADAYFLLVCDSAQSEGRLLIFRKKILLQYSGSNCKLSNKSAEVAS